MVNPFQNSDGPIGTAYTVIEPAYCVADEEFPASTSTRYACACRVYLPTVGVVDEISADELWAALFG